MNYKDDVLDLIRNIRKTDGTDSRGAIRDVLTEIIHICRDRNLDPHERFQAALEVADEEAGDGCEY